MNDIAKPSIDKVKELVVRSVRVETSSCLKHLIKHLQLILKYLDHDFRVEWAFFRFTESAELFDIGEDDDLFPLLSALLGVLLNEDKPLFHF